MGYMLNGNRISIIDSDTAADAMFKIEDMVIKQLKSIMKTKENSYNTDGIINAAMIVVEAFSSIGWTEYSVDFRDFVNDELIPKLDAYILRLSNEEWDEVSSKRQHLKAFNIISKELKRLFEE